MKNKNNGGTVEQRVQEQNRALADMASGAMAPRMLVAKYRPNAAPRGKVRMVIVTAEGSPEVIKGAIDSVMLWNMAGGGGGIKRKERKDRKDGE